MVVVCESCSTRFRIDDARIPAKGRLVRCSQCKATFVAKPNSASFEETVQEVVAEVTAAGGTPVPEPAADLFDVGGEDLSDRPGRRAVGSDDERWEFDETPRAAAPEVEQVEETQEPVSPAEAAAAPLEEVGDPAEWDLLRDSVEPAAREAKFVEPEPPPRAPVAKAAPEPLLRPAAAEPRVRRPERSEARRSVTQLGRLGITAAAWFALAALVLAGVTPLFAGGAGLRSARMAPKSFALADGEAHAVHASFVENAFVGTLLVIRGELSRPSPDPRLGLRVYLVGVDGARLGEGRWAGVARSPHELRGLAPERLQREGEASAAAAALGESFVAVFELAREATGFELALEALPEAAPATSAAGTEAEPASAPR